MGDDILHRLTAQCRGGSLNPDEGQTAVAEALQALADALKTYRPPWRWPLLSPRRPPRGLYIHGTVGRGKSMMMDLFFSQAPTLKKWRVHFHEFMEHIHDRRNALKGQSDPLPMIAKDVSRRAWLLCFDEFQVENIADAMILSRFFDALFARGVIVVATSNQKPCDLYASGLHRERFLPFTQLLEDKLKVISIGDGEDYRRHHIRANDLYQTPLGPTARARIDAMVAALTHQNPVTDSFLDVGGRRLPIRASRDVVRFDFAELCEQPLGSSDYRALTTHFKVVVLENIPALSDEKKDAATRFTTLIDIVYDCRCTLICSAAHEPERLFTGRGGTRRFARTISRLEEMRSHSYAALSDRYF